MKEGKMGNVGKLKLSGTGVRVEETHLHWKRGKCIWESE